MNYIHLNIRLEKGLVLEDIGCCFVEFMNLTVYFFLSGIMSSSHMDVVPDACIDVLDIMADDDFNFEESIFNLEVKEFGYVANMGCPVADCNFQGTFPSRRNSSTIGKSVMFVRYRSGRALTKDVRHWSGGNRT